MKAEVIYRTLARVQYSFWTFRNRKKASFRQLKPIWVRIVQTQNVCWSTVWDKWEFVQTALAMYKDPIF